MKIVRFLFQGTPGYGLDLGENILKITGDPFSELRFIDISIPKKDVKMLAPCYPSKVVGVGLNYRRHAEELRSETPDTPPLIFLKPSTAVIGPDENIIYPKLSKRVDYEGELAVVIKRRASKVAIAEADDYILGYTCFNDVTARDLQEKDGQWTRAKGFDSFAPVGPCIETELEAGKVTIETFVNGELRQKGNTADLIHTVPELVSYISQIMTLLPGDVIATGTPAGIGELHSGDTVEVKIAQIGSLRNFVVSQP